MSNSHYQVYRVLVREKACVKQKNHPGVVFLFDGERRAFSFSTIQVQVGQVLVGRALVGRALAGPTAIRQPLYAFLSGQHRLQ